MQNSPGILKVVIWWFDALPAIEGSTNSSVALTGELLNTLFFCSDND